MTNIETIKPNKNLAIALVPPAEVGSIISHAMYLGPEERLEEAGHYLNPVDVDLSAVNALMYHELTRI